MNFLRRFPSRFGSVQGREITVKFAVRRGSLRRLLLRLSLTVMEAKADKEKHLVLPVASPAFKSHVRSSTFSKVRRVVAGEGPTPEGVRAALHKYAKDAHVAGSDQDLVTAKVVLESFYNSFGLSYSPEDLIYEAGSTQSQGAIYDFSSKDTPKAWIDTYYSLLDTPQEQGLQIVDETGNVIWTADLKEVCDPIDEDSYRICSVVHPYHGFSADGDVTGELVYANYGNLEDFEDLEERGVNVSGKILLTRYGTNMRSLKVQNAQSRGAAGVLIYSDIRDDGGVTVENGFLPYPNGPARNPTAIQRGSVQYLTLYPGDPTTPGVPSYKNSTRVEDVGVPAIPSLPLSWKNTQYLFSQLNETAIVRLRLVNKVQREVKPIWNSMAVIPGHMTDEVIVFGNHRDAWGLGAVDPSSGSAVMDEIIRGFGTLYKKGWKPLRTIILASWDAEEYGIIGSTEWGEDFAEWIGKNVVAYVNVDGSVGGSRWGAGASPSLSHFLRQIAQDLPHPSRPNATIWDSQRDVGPYLLPGTNITEEPLTDDLKSVAPLGSGSDFVTFLQRIGIASTTSGFDSAPGDAVYHYHSVYDSIPFVERFLDPKYGRFNAMSKYLGLEVLRLADAIVLPINTTHYTLELTTYTEKVATAAKELNIAVDLSPLHKAISHLYDATKKLDKEKEGAVKALIKSLKRWHKKRFARSIWDRIRRFLKRGTFGEDEEIEVNLEDMTTRLFESGHHIPCDVKKAIKRIRKVNSVLKSFEAGFISEEGLPGRNWYRHFGVAPGKQLGYGATTFPSLTESITLDKNAPLAKVEVERLSKMIKKLAERI
ncbi:hypothetical protein Clacol_007065 [Clathrus columnatus]|uniref:Zn-dependent exopeptidase n=1 Tax=Clathrus columnatus TaxID=1419009 RepID=A0AAV5ALM4_9AGAM|nr:hypothetical protein Clacol_007065 [Clathrus columnatus]